MFRNLTTLCCLLVASLRVYASEVSPTECDRLTSPRGSRYEIGLVYQAVIPSGLADFTTTIPVYGPVLGIPLFGGTLQLQGVLGRQSTSAGSSLSVYLAELTYRFEITTPFLNVFALGGAHYLYHSLTPGANHAGLGANLGLGLSFLMGQGFEINLGLRTYLQSRSTVSFGGGFSFLL